MILSLAPNKPSSCCVEAAAQSLEAAARDLLEGAWTRLWPLFRWCVCGRMQGVVFGRSFLKLHSMKDAVSVCASYHSRADIKPSKFIPPWQVHPPGALLAHTKRRPALLVGTQQIFTMASAQRSGLRSNELISRVTSFFFLNSNVLCSAGRCAWLSGQQVGTVPARAAQAPGGV